MTTRRESWAEKGRKNMGDLIGEQAVNDVIRCFRWAIAGVLGVPVLLVMIFVDAYLLPERVELAIGYLGIAAWTAVMVVALVFLIRAKLAAGRSYGLPAWSAWRLRLFGREVFLASLARAQRRGGRR